MCIITVQCVLLPCKCMSCPCNVMMHDQNGCITGQISPLRMKHYSECMELGLLIHMAVEITQHSPTSSQRISFHHWQWPTGLATASIFCKQPVLPPGFNFTKTQLTPYCPHTDGELKKNSFRIFLKKNFWIVFFITLGVQKRVFEWELILISGFEIVSFPGNSLD